MKDLTFYQIRTIAVGIVEWAVAIVSVLGTLGLVAWIVKMIVTKDNPDELN